MSSRILLIEDEPGMQLTLSDRLRSVGYDVETADDGESGLARAIGEHFDLVILDVMLPRRNGFDICRDLRRQRSDLPVMMLTARGQVVDKVTGFKLGADDYLAKPFEMLELLARVEALLRRTATRAAAAEPPRTYQFGLVSVDLLTATVQREEQPVDLSTLEYRLLCYFIDHRGETLSRQTLLNEVWGYHVQVSTRTVDVHVAWLRQKLEIHPRHPQYILTVHGVGYRFVG